MGERERATRRLGESESEEKRRGEKTEGAFAFSRLLHNFSPEGGETQWEHRMQEFTSPSRINGVGRW